MLEGFVCLEKKSHRPGEGRLRGIYGDRENRVDIRRYICTATHENTKTSKRMKFPMLRMETRTQGNRIGCLDPASVPARLPVLE